MARIRTVKPDFFKHYDLFKAEEETKLPLRLAFVGLWTVADREGRFKWRPQQIKLDVLPYDNVDMNNVLSKLEEFGYICKYEIEGKAYGYIPTWQHHQRPNREEPASEIPSPGGEFTEYDRPPNQTMRLKIYERDNFICVYCGDNLKDKPRSICLDHVIPYSKGGTNREKNLATSCKKCNSIKGNKIPTECGFVWPQGLGESYLTGGQRGVNGVLTGGQQPLYPEGEGEREGSKGREGKGKGGGELPLQELNTVIWDIEKHLIEHQKDFEIICMDAKKSKDQVLAVLKKFHLWNQEKENYPKKPLALIAGFKKWLLNEKIFSNGTYFKGSQSATAGGQDPTRINTEGLGNL